MIHSQRIRDCELPGSNWDIRESLGDCCRRGQRWQVSAAAHRLLDVNPLQQRQHTQSSSQNPQHRAGMGSWSLEMDGCGGRFLKGCPASWSVLHHAHPGSTKFMECIAHVKLGEKVMEGGEGLKGRERMMDLIKTQYLCIKPSIKWSRIIR